MSNPYAIAAVNNQRNLAKAAQLLVGICSGIVADGKVTDDEILFLQQWIQEHAEVTSVWPGNMIAQRIADILEDGIITTEERDDLLLTLQEISGNLYLETGVAQQDTPALPIDENPHIEISGKTVCFTGKFIFGPRAACEDAVAHYGGIPASTITKKIRLSGDWNISITRLDHIQLWKKN